MIFLSCKIFKNQLEKDQLKSKQKLKHTTVLSYQPTMFFLEVNQVLMYIFAWEKKVWFQIPNALKILSRVEMRDRMMQSNSRVL